MGSSEKIEDYYNVNILNSNFNKDKKYLILDSEINSRPIKVCVLRFDILNNKQLLREMFEKLGYDNTIIIN